MTANKYSAAPTLLESNPDNVARALAKGGLWIDLGASTVRVRSDSNAFSSQLRAAYGTLPFVDHADWADLHVEVRRATGLRRWLRPQVVLWCDGQQPFEPFPADSPLPLFECHQPSDCLSCLATRAEVDR